MLGDAVEARHILELLEVGLEGRRVDVVGGLGAVHPHLEDEGDRAAAELLAQHGLESPAPGR